MSAENLPAINAVLNACATVLLLLGYRFIRRGEKEAHKRTMIAATVVSTLFLIGYLTHKAIVQKDKLFPDGYGAWKPFYLFVILLPHVVLAAVNVPLIAMTLIYALRDKVEKHKRIARITWISWLYVSVTGVLIYFFLYHWFPPLAQPV